MPQQRSTNRNIKESIMYRFIIATALAITFAFTASAVVDTTFRCNYIGLG
ncbi:MAG: hypothetical protein ACI9MR_004423 [Myxococcota bacterium]|jgi:hypothetical protein